MQFIKRKNPSYYITPARPFKYWYYDDLNMEVCLDYNDHYTRAIKVRQLKKHTLNEWLIKLRKTIGFMDEQGFCSLYRKIIRGAYKVPEKV